MPLIGLDFFPGERLAVSVVSPQGTSRPLGSVVSGGDGHFETTFDLPADLPAGLVTIDAVSGSGITVRAFVTIDPAAPPASYRPVFPTRAEQAGSPEVDLVPLAAVGLAVAGLALLVRGSRRPKPSR